MIPKKAREYYKDFSEENELSKALTESVMDFYYKKLREALVSLDDPRINVEGLGHFVVKKNLVKKSIGKYQSYLTNHDTSTFNAYYNKKMLEEKVQKLILLSEKLDEMDKKLETFINNKNEKYSKTNLAEQETDSGGDN
jgi:hypothetical protein